jgi:hypothetical protein
MPSARSHTFSTFSTCLILAIMSLKGSGADSQQYFQRYAQGSAIPKGIKTTNVATRLECAILCMKTYRCLGYSMSPQVSEAGRFVCVLSDAPDFWEISAANDSVVYKYKMACEYTLFHQHIVTVFGFARIILPCVTCICTTGARTQRYNIAASCVILSVATCGDVSRL